MSARRNNCPGVMVSGMVAACPPSGGDAIEARLQISFAAGADDLVGHFTLLEEQQSRDARNAVLRGERLLLVHVDLADLGATIVFRGEFIQHRRDHFAWP